MYALVDCNSFYASCEQIFRPDLRNQPVVVLSNNDGCIIARSKEAKALGIPDLHAYFKVKPFLKKHNVTVFSANFCLYGDISWRVMETLRQFSPATEVYSIDEMFVDLHGNIEPLDTLGRNIKQRIWQHVRMPVGVGIAPTKTLAKLANRGAKHIARTQGVCVLDTAEKWQWLQRRLPVEKVWGVGQRFAKRLNRLGIYTIFDLAQASAKRVREHSNVNLERTVEELNGVPCYALEDAHANKKQIYVTRSFGKKATTSEELRNHISRYASAAAEKLRAQNCKASVVTVFVQTSPFEDNYYGNAVTLPLPHPTDDSRDLIYQARKMIASLYRPGHRFQRCGFGIVEMFDNTYRQFDLFHSGQTQQSEIMMTTLDRINRRYGRDTAVFGAEGLRGKWTMRQNYLSPRYTTSWKDLPTVKCIN